MLLRSHRTVLGGAARAAVVPPAALAVHQLRYLLTYGRGTGRELRMTGHSYLHSLVPWLVLLLGLAGGAFLWALSRSLSGHRCAPRRSLSFLAVWLACTAVLLAVFCVQELLEGVFAFGHPSGLAGVFGFGGWWAVPAAGGVGLVLVALLHGSRVVLDEVARRWASAPTSRAAALFLPLRGSLCGRVPLAAPVAGGWSGRGPPPL
jgi:hypothetical protein